jgi:glucose/mannose-6-phosphate isomerase
MLVGTYVTSIASPQNTPYLPTRSGASFHNSHSIAENRPGFDQDTWSLLANEPTAGRRLALPMSKEPRSQVYAAAAMLERVSERCRPDSESFLNPAKEIALQLAGTLPAIWGSTPLAGVAAYRFACQLNENAKYPGIHGVLPGANHNQVVAFDGPFAPGREPHPPGPAGGPGGGAGAGVPLRLVMLVDAPEHPQVTKRREASAELARERGIGVTELAAEGEHPLARLASLIQLIDYSTVYLGIALGLDPSPISAIG